MNIKKIIVWIIENILETLILAFIYSLFVVISLYIIISLIILIIYFLMNGSLGYMTDFNVYYHRGIIVLTIILFIYMFIKKPYDETKETLYQMFLKDRVKRK